MNALQCWECQLGVAVVAGLWKRLQDVKPVWTEPHGADTVERCIGEYCTAIRDQRGGLFIAVCRGKVPPLPSCCIQGGAVTVVVHVKLY